MTIRLPGILPSWLDKEVAKAEEKRFSSELDKARKSGRYPLHVAATLIAQAAGPLVSPMKMEERLMLAMQDKSLPVYDMHQKARWDGVIPFFGLLEIYWDDLNNWLDENEPRIGPIFQNPQTLVGPTKTNITKKAESRELWEIKDPRDPEPKEPWNTAARYFARQLVKKDITLLRKRDLLATKIVQSLTEVGIKKRGGKKPFNPGTIKKAFSKVDFG